MADIPKDFFQRLMQDRPDDNSSETPDDLTVSVKLSLDSISSFLNTKINNTETVQLQNQIGQTVETISKAVDTIKENKNKFEKEFVGFVLERTSRTKTTFETIFKKLSSIEERRREYISKKKDIRRDSSSDELEISKRIHSKLNSGCNTISQFSKFISNNSQNIADAFKNTATTIKNYGEGFFENTVGRLWNFIIPKSSILTKAMSFLVNSSVGMFLYIKEKTISGLLTTTKIIGELKKIGYKAIFSIFSGLASGAKKLLPVISSFVLKFLTSPAFLLASALLGPILWKYVKPIVSDFLGTAFGFYKDKLTKLSETIGDSIFGKVFKTVTQWFGDLFSFIFSQKHAEQFRKWIGDILGISSDQFDKVLNLLVKWMEQPWSIIKDMLSFGYDMFKQLVDEALKLIPNSVIITTLKGAFDAVVQASTLLFQTEIDEDPEIEAALHSIETEVGSQLDSDIEQSSQELQEAIKDQEGQIKGPADEFVAKTESLKKQAEEADLDEKISEIDKKYKEADLDEITERAKREGIKVDSPISSPKTLKEIEVEPAQAPTVTLLKTPPMEAVAARNKSIEDRTVTIKPISRKSTPKIEKSPDVAIINTKITEARSVGKEGNEINQYIEDLAPQYVLMNDAITWTTMIQKTINMSSSDSSVQAHHSKIIIDAQRVIQNINKDITKYVIPGTNIVYDPLTQDSITMNSDGSISFNNNWSKDKVFSNIMSSGKAYKIHSSSPASSDEVTGFETGGLVKASSLAIVAEGGDPEVIFPINDEGVRFIFETMKLIEVKEEPETESTEKKDNIQRVIRNSPIRTDEIVYDMKMISQGIVGL